MMTWMVVAGDQEALASREIREPMLCWMRWVRVEEMVGKSSLNFSLMKGRVEVAVVASRIWEGPWEMAMKDLKGIG